MEIQGKRVQNHSQATSAGDFWWNGAKDHLYFNCPSGAEGVICCPLISNGDEKVYSPAVLPLDYDKPSIVEVITGHNWTGYLVDGVFKTLK